MLTFVLIGREVSWFSGLLFWQLCSCIVRPDTGTIDLLHECWSCSLRQEWEPRWVKNGEYSSSMRNTIMFTCGTHSKWFIQYYSLVKGFHVAHVVPGRSKRCEEPWYSFIMMELKMYVLWAEELGPSTKRHALSSIHQSIRKSVRLVGMRGSNRMICGDRWQRRKHLFT